MSKMNAVKKLAPDAEAMVLFSPSLCFIFFALALALALALAFPS
jgi:hypothetical protein